MSRAVFRIGSTALLLCACAAVWLWWFTAPPRAAMAELATLTAEAQPDVDGILAIGDPARSARWLARHPQALLPLAFAAPEIAPALRRLAPAARFLAGRSTSGVVLWWRGGEVALAAPVDEELLRSQALAPLAAAFGLHYAHATSSEGRGLVFFTTGPGLLDARGRPAPPAADGPAMAICRIGGRWWRVTATRNALQGTTGEPPQPSSPGERSVATFSDLRRHLPALAAFGADRPLALAVAMNPGGWALALPGMTLPSHMTRLLGVGAESPAGSAPGSRRWDGALGEVWVDSRHGLALGSSPERLDEVAGQPIRDAGAIRAAEVSQLVESAARRLDHLPGLGREVSELRAFSRSISGLRSARWDVGKKGGHVRLEW